MRLCPTCNKPIVKRSTESNWRFIRRTYCTPKCARGIVVNSLEERYRQVDRKHEKEWRDMSIFDEYEN